MDPNCLRCSHPLSSHAKEGERQCRRKTLTGWSEETKTFANDEMCECEGYLGRVPNHEVGKRGCPHELVEGSRVCVVCKEPVPAKAKR